MVLKYLFIVITGQNFQYVNLMLKRWSKELDWLKLQVTYTLKLISKGLVVSVCLIRVRNWLLKKGKVTGVFRYYAGVGDFVFHHLLVFIFILGFYFYGGVVLEFMGEYFYRVFDPYLSKGLGEELVSVEQLAREYLQEKNLGSDEMITEYRPYVVSIVFLQVGGFLVFLVWWFRSLREILKLVWKQLFLLYLVIYYWYIVNECQMLPGILKYLIYAPQVFEI